MRKKLHFAKKQKKRTTFLKSRPFWYGVLFFVIGMLSFTMFFLSSFAKIDEIKVSTKGFYHWRSTDLKEAKYLIAQSLLKDILLIPRNNHLLVDEKAIEKSITGRFPEVAEVRVVRDSILTLFANMYVRSPVSLLVSIQEKKEAATFVYTKEENPRYFALDPGGKVFKEYDDLHHPIVIQDTRESIPAMREQVIAKELLTFIQALDSNIQETLLFSLQEERIDFYDIVSEDRVAIVVLPRGWEIFFTPKEDLDWQMTKLRLVLQEKISTEERSQLEYIDLRFGSQAYIKYRD
tara:strand:+ start:4449 stop:5324 length:876 start_codon:yes stop_codon:yes gene_type:complete